MHVIDILRIIWGYFWAAGAVRLGGIQGGVPRCETHPLNPAEITIQCMQQNDVHAHKKQHSTIYALRSPYRAWQQEGAGGAGAEELGGDWLSWGHVQHSLHVPELWS
jgi:hypothetical protein